MDKELDNSPGPGLLKAATVAAGGPPVPAAAPARDALAVGLDIESADNLPSLADPWSEPFYVDNFTRAEIAWCLRQPDPPMSFCGLWSAKEAALKCGQEFAGLRPIEIEILRDHRGRAMLRLLLPSPATGTARWLLSISHAGRMAMAVCVKERQPN
jgi:phosphopantetheine--protein transferase-like protein